MGAFGTGLQAGIQNEEAKQLHQQGISDLELETKIKDAQSSIGNLQTKIADMKPGTPEYLETSSALTKAVQARNDLFHPAKNPGAIQKFGHLLHIGPKPVQQSVTTKNDPVTIPAGTTGPITLAATEPFKGSPQAMPSLGKFMATQSPAGLIETGNIPIWNRPTIQNADGSKSSELSVSFADENGHEILVPTIVDGKFLTPDGKMPPGPVPTDHENAPPAWKALWDNAWKHYEQTGQHLGKFDSAANADAYADVLHNRGTRDDAGSPEVIANGLPTEAQAIQFPGKDVTVKGPPQLPSQLREQAERFRKAQSEAQEIIAGAPMSQEQMQTILSNAQDYARINSIKNTMKAIPDLLGPDATPEDVEKAKADYLTKELGILEKENWEEMDGTVDGNAVTWQRDKTSGRVTDLNGQPVSGEKLAKFVKAPKGGAAAKPPTSQFAINLDGYAKSHGFTDWNAYPANQKEKVIDYVQRKIALDRAIPKSTTSIRIMQDMTGAFVPVTETNYSTPGGNIKLVDPFPVQPKLPDSKERTETAAQTTPPQNGTTTPTPGPGNQAAQRAPSNAHSNAHSSTPNAPTGQQTPSGTKALIKEAKAKALKANTNVSVGAPLFQGRTPESDAAGKALDSARTAYRDVEEASKQPTPVGDQGIVLAWLRGRVNRVTATEIQNVNNLGGATMKLEGKWVKITSGLMTDSQREWFKKSAKDNLDIAQENYDRYKNPQSNNTTTPSGTSSAVTPDAPPADIDAIVNALNPKPPATK